MDDGAAKVRVCNVTTASSECYNMAPATFRQRYREVAELPDRLLSGSVEELRDLIFPHLQAAVPTDEEAPG